MARCFPHVRRTTAMSSERFHKRLSTGFPQQSSNPFFAAYPRSSSYGPTTYQLEDSEAKHASYIARFHTFVTQPLLRPHGLSSDVGGRCYHNRDQTATNRR